MNPALSQPLEFAVYAALFFLGLAFALSFFRLMKGPTLPDRVVALDLIATLAIGLIAIYNIITGEAYAMRAAIVLALVAFLATTAFAYYVQKRGKE